MNILHETFTIDPRSLPEQVAEKIEELVINQTFKVGEKIPTEPELASTLNVGRSTIREAIKILAARNILEVRRGFGTFVCQNIGISDDPLGFRFESNQKKLALDLCEIRRMIEPNLAYLAAIHATCQDIEELQTLCNEVSELIRKKQNYGHKDTEFHTKISQCTNNLVVPKLVPIINTAIDTYIGITNSSLAGQAIAEHQLIVDAIRCHNPDSAKTAMEKHLKANKKTLEALQETKN